MLSGILTGMINLFAADFLDACKKLEAGEPLTDEERRLVSGFGPVLMESTRKLIETLSAATDHIKQDHAKLVVLEGALTQMIQASEEKKAIFDRLALRASYEQFDLHLHPTGPETLEVTVTPHADELPAGEIAKELHSLFTSEAFRDELRAAGREGAQAVIERHLAGLKARGLKVEMHDVTDLTDEELRTEIDKLRADGVEVEEVGSYSIGELFGEEPASATTE